MLALLSRVAVLARTSARVLRVSSRTLPRCARLKLNAPKTKVEIEANERRTVSLRVTPIELGQNSGAVVGNFFDSRFELY